MSLEMTPKLLDAFIQEVHNRTGVHLEKSKATMLSGRLRRRARALNLDSLDDYLARLAKDHAEQTEFIHAVTTHKTNLFRTSGVWSYLYETALPALVDEKGRGKVSIWSAACSTGEEPATAGMLCQHFANGKPGFRYNITASDISGPVVKAAEKAVFAERTLNRVRTGVDSLDPKAYLEKDPEGLRLQKRIRNNITYQTHNLFDQMRGRFDIILLRNVLIYFTPEDKKKVVSNACKALTRNGMLVIGESESLFDSGLDLEMVTHCIYRPTR